MSLLNVYKKYWKWIFVFLFLPTLNGCEPSLGYPISIPVPAISADQYFYYSTPPDEEGFPYILIFSMILINIIIFLLFIKFIGEYFDKHKFRLKVFMAFFIYEGVLAFLKYFLVIDPLNPSILSTLTNDYSLSFYVFAKLSGYLGIFDVSSSPSLFIYHIVKFIAMIIVTLIVLVVSIILEKIFLKFNILEKIQNLKSSKLEK